MAYHRRMSAPLGKPSAIRGTAHLQPGITSAPVQNTAQQAAAARSSSQRPQAAGVSGLRSVASEVLAGGYGLGWT